MYSEVNIAPEINPDIQQKLRLARDKDSRSSFSAIWDRVRKENPDLFGKLKAEDRQVDEREAKQLTLAEHKALFALERLNQIKLERPKKVEATQPEDSSVLVASQIRFEPISQTPSISHRENRGRGDFFLSGLLY